MQNLGPEIVKAELLTRLGPVAINICLQVFDQILKTSIATIWRNAVIIPVLKVNKPGAELFG
jgi:hypothetical protein